MDSFNYKPIGYIKSDLQFKQDSPTQGTRVESSVHCIELDPGFDFEQCLDGLAEFERLWVIYEFHKNGHWKTKVNVPRKEEKLGVFATRSPYRPNPIGMTCVKLVKIDGRKLYVEESDLIDGSPVLDLKPYIDYSDSFETSYPDWLELAEENLFKITLPEYILKRFEFLKKKGKLNVSQFVKSQLEFEPLNEKKKRVEVLENREDDTVAARIAYRTWRIDFEVNLQTKKLFVTAMNSAYSKEELLDKEDPYGDKDLHRRFLKNFN